MSALPQASRPLDGITAKRAPLAAVQAALLIASSKRGANLGWPIFSAVPFQMLSRESRIHGTLDQPKAAASGMPLSIAMARMAMATPKVLHHGVERGRLLLRLTSLVQRTEVRLGLHSPGLKTLGRHHREEGAIGRGPGGEGSGRRRHVRVGEAAVAGGAVDCEQQEGRELGLAHLLGGAVPDVIEG